MRRMLLGISCMLAIGTGSVAAQQTTTPPAQTTTPAATPSAPTATTAAPADSAAWAAWQSFLPGTWSCAGAFSNGRKLEADMTFAATLDNRWITYSHQDRAPGTFKASAMWGIQSGSKRLLSTMHDNFGGARRFDGTATADQVTFVIDRAFSPAKLVERFRWQREGEKLRMTWEIARSADSWVMGDWLLCERRP